MAGGRLIETSDDVIRTTDLNTGWTSILAGTGYQGFAGDGGPATQAALSNPEAVAVDAQGRVFIADTGNNRVRRVDLAGTISTVVANGVNGFTGTPRGLAFDSVGDLYIASNQYRIWRLSSAGTLSSIAGDGTSGYSGDGGPATSARFNNATDLEVDSQGNLFIVDAYNYVVRMVTSDGLISTVAGNGIQGDSDDGGQATAGPLNAPAGVAVDAGGNLYIAEYSGCKIRRVSPQGVITTVAGNGYAGFAGDGGPASAAELQFPEDVAMDPSGGFFVADRFNYRIRRVDGGSVMTTYGGTGEPGFGGDGGLAIDAQLNWPSAAAGNTQHDVYIADTANNRIRKVSHDGTTTTVAGTSIRGYNGDGIAATAAELYQPAGVAVDAAGAVYIADTGNHRVRRIRTDGQIETIAGNGARASSGDGGIATAASFIAPIAVAVDQAGNVFVSDTQANEVRKISTDGHITAFAGTGAPGFSGDGGPATAATLTGPSSIAIATNGNIVIADTYNNRIRTIDTTGHIATVAGNGTRGYGGDDGPATTASLNGPVGIALQTDGRMAIADTQNNRIRLVDTNGTITTAVGDGTAGLSGDGSEATHARVNLPSGVLFDADSKLYVVDTINSRVRLIT